VTVYSTSGAGTALAAGAWTAATRPKTDALTSDGTTIRRRIMASILFPGPRSGTDFSRIVRAFCATAIGVAVQSFPSRHQSNEADAVACTSPSPETTASSADPPTSPGVPCTRIGSITKTGRCKRKSNVRRFPPWARANSAM
jgi:hypothetical protein